MATPVFEFTHRDFLPADVKAGRMKLAEYLIWPIGFASDSFGRFTIDNSVFVAQSHPDSTIYLCPKAGRAQPTVQQVTFWADCLAFEHDCPMVPVLRSADYRKLFTPPLKVGPRSETHSIHRFDGEETSVTTQTHRLPRPRDVFSREIATSIAQVADLARELRHGHGTYVTSQYRAFQGNLDYTASCGAVADAVHFYAASLRQPDLVAEYLFCFRALEAVLGSSVKGWIKKRLGRVPTYKGPRTLIAHDHDSPEKRRAYLEDLLVRRASRRLAVLRAALGSPAAIATHLVTINRNGAAHGGPGIRSDFSRTYFQLGEDTCLLRVLARVAIDAKARHHLRRP